MKKESPALVTEEDTRDALAPTEDPNLGMVLQERYRIVRKLGEGGMGRVYEAEHVLIKKRVAIKCLHSQFASNAEVVSRFQREAQAATAIGNEHIVEVTDMGRFPDGAVFMALEFLDGRDLATEIESSGAFSIGRAVRIITQVCEALAAAHEKGIVHRDLKPENIFLVRRRTDPDFVKILDFGISKFKDSDAQSLTATGAMIGTPSYMAPEQIEGCRDIDHRADLYAMGVILFVMLTGQTPFNASTLPKLVYEVCSVEAPAIGDLRDGIPAELQAVVARLLKKDPAARFASCDDLRAALDPFLMIEDVSGTPIRALPPSPSGIRPGGGSQSVHRRSLTNPDVSSIPTTGTTAAATPAGRVARGTMLKVAGGVALLAALAVLAVALSQRDTAPAEPHERSSSTRLVRRASPSPAATTTPPPVPAPPPPPVVTPLPTGHPPTLSAPTPVPSTLPADAPAVAQPATGEHGRRRPHRRGRSSHEHRSNEPGSPLSGSEMAPIL